MATTASRSFSDVGAGVAVREPGANGRVGPRPGGLVMDERLTRLTSVRPGLHRVVT